MTKVNNSAISTTIARTTSLVSIQSTSTMARSTQSQIVSPSTFTTTAINYPHPSVITPSSSINQVLTEHTYGYIRSPDNAIGAIRMRGEWYQQIDDMVQGVVDRVLNRPVIIIDIAQGREGNMQSEGIRNLPPLLLLYAGRCHGHDYYHVPITNKNGDHQIMEITADDDSFFRAVLTALYEDPSYATDERIQYLRHQFADYIVKHQTESQEIVSDNFDFGTGDNTISLLEQAEQNICDTRQMMRDVDHMIKEKSQFPGTSIATTYLEDLTAQLAANVEIRSTETPLGSVISQEDDMMEVGDDIIDSIRTGGSWDNQAGDIVANIAARVLNRPMQIIDIEHRTTMAINPENISNMSPIVLLRINNNHYDVFVEGADGIQQHKAIPADGDCFYRAILTALNQDLSVDDVQALRNRFADYIAEHRAEFQEFIAEDFDLEVEGKAVQSMTEAYQIVGKILKDSGFPSQLHHLPNDIVKNEQGDPVIIPALGLEALLCRPLPGRNIDNLNLKEHIAQMLYKGQLKQHFLKDFFGDERLFQLYQKSPQDFSNLLREIIIKDKRLLITLQNTLPSLRLLILKNIKKIGGYPLMDGRRCLPQLLAQMHDNTRSVLERWWKTICDAFNKNEMVETLLVNPRTVLAEDLAQAIDRPIEIARTIVNELIQVSRDGSGLSARRTLLDNRLRALDIYDLSVPITFDQFDWAMGKLLQAVIEGRLDIQTLDHWLRHPGALTKFQCISQDQIVLGDNAIRALVNEQVMPNVLGELLRLIEQIPSIQHALISELATLAIANNYLIPNQLRIWLEECRDHSDALIYSVFKQPVIMQAIAAGQLNPETLNRWRADSQLGQKNIQSIDLNTWLRLSRSEINEQDIDKLLSSQKNIDAKEDEHSIKKRRIADSCKPLSPPKATRRDDPDSDMGPSTSGGGSNISIPVLSAQMDSISSPSQMNTQGNTSNKYQRLEIVRRMQKLTQPLIINQHKELTQQKNILSTDDLQHPMIQKEISQAFVNQPQNKKITRGFQSLYLTTSLSTMRSPSFPIEIERRQPSITGMNLHMPSAILPSSNRQLTLPSTTVRTRVLPGLSTMAEAVADKPPQKALMWK